MVSKIHCQNTCLVKAIKALITPLEIRCRHQCESDRYFELKFKLKFFIVLGWYRPVCLYLIDLCSNSGWLLCVTSLATSWVYTWPNSQIPRCTCSISHNATFRTEMYTFLFWMVHCGIWNWCIVGFVRLVYCGVLHAVFCEYFRCYWTLNHKLISLLHFFFSWDTNRDTKAIFQNTSSVCIIINA